MVDGLSSEFQDEVSERSLSSVEQKLVKRVHVHLPDTPTPTSAIFYNEQFYAYVKFFPNLQAAERAVERLTMRGNSVVLTRITKGFVLWVLEPEARLVERHPV